MRLLTLGLLLAPTAFAANDDLMSIYNDALATNPALQAAQAAVEAARFDIEAANAGLRPSISASTNVNGSEVTRSASAPETGTAKLAGSITASMPIWSPAARASIDFETASASLTQSSAKATLNQLQIDIAQRYLDVLNAQAALSAAQAQEQAVERQLERAQKRLEVGLGTRVEVDQTQAAYDNTQVALIRAEDTLSDAREALETAANREVAALTPLSTSYPAIPSTLTLSDVIEQAQSNSVGIESARSSVEIAEAALKLAQAGGKPSLNANASYSTDKSLDGGLWSNGYSTQITLSMPLYTGGKVQAEVASAAASLAKAQAELEDQRRAVKAQARSLFRAIGTQAQTVRAQAQSIKSAQTAVEATQAAFEVGSGDIIDVLNAQSDLNAAQSNYAQARHQHAALVLQLEQLRGDLTQDDLLALNNQLGR